MTELRDIGEVGCALEFTVKTGIAVGLREADVRITRKAGNKRRAGLVQRGEAVRAARARSNITASNCGRAVAEATVRTVVRHSTGYRTVRTKAVYVVDAIPRLADAVDAGRCLETTIRIAVRRRSNPITAKTLARSFLFDRAEAVDAALTAPAFGARGQVVCAFVVAKAQRQIRTAELEVGVRDRTEPFVELADASRQTTAWTVKKRARAGRRCVRRALPALPS